MDQERTYENVFIARQPIFDEVGKTWGYMLLFRDSQHATSASFTDNSEATMRVLANMPMCNLGTSPDAGVMVHFPAESIIKGIHRAMRSDCGVIVLEENEDVSPELVDALQSIREEGYKVAINNYQGLPDKEELYKAADILIVDLLDKNQGDLAALVKKAKEHGNAKLMAKRVENIDVQRMAKKSGCSLFHGFYYKKPEVDSARKISSNEITRLKLFEIIERDEPDFDALAQAVEADVSISYRLLGFLNSASFGFATTITSIKQAVVLAGWKPIRNWLRVVILTDLTPSEKSRELTYLSAHRAKLFETAALGGGYENISDKLFMLGLFSLLDAMFDMEMKEVVKHLPIDDSLKKALCGAENEYSEWLRLAFAIENSNWEEVGHTARALNLLPGTVAVSYQHAFTWADSFFGTDYSSSTPH
ncbi:EAL and HDOD domain-containing protein [Salidesulfovibrio onnuriiensis]|uniref:EAL and HDOD domain-containing protein n=1 Tax=Salidesulfovibrio onnuriiensis TaxID=2583823 RepID=UPI0011CBE6D4|nr:HDOD domain-containing protein [Salidesulfovibrio onnuriiensis]